MREDLDSVGRKTLIFEPTDPYERDHDIKLLRKTYLYQDLPASETGIGTQTVGQVDLTGSFVSGINSIGVAPGISTSIKTLASLNVSGVRAIGKTISGSFVVTIPA